LCANFGRAPARAVERAAQRHAFRPGVSRGKRRLGVIDSPPSGRISSISAPISTPDTNPLAQPARFPPRSCALRASKGNELSSACFVRRSFAPFHHRAVLQPP
jgi:hypothetical protein